MSDHDTNLAADIAIVGMRCRFPGADGTQQFWEVLRGGCETVSRFTEDELLAAGVPAERLSHPHYVRARGIVPGIEDFDTDFFGIEPLRATAMDPQQRVFLEFAWQALEDAGYDTGQYDGRIGLFAGVAFNTYLLNNLRHADLRHSRAFNSIELLITSDKDFLTTQTAYHLGLTGPAVTVQTACSTSLVSVHLACQSLLSQECDMALAGAVTLYSPQVKGYLYEPGSIVSPDGHVRSYDADGQGTVYSSGIGLVVLKRLEDAQRDGDTIHAVIKGTAVNNDGGRKSAFKMPSEEGLLEVIETALSVADVDPSTIGYLEGNGSGTALGDAIEVAALTRAFRLHTDRRGFCPLGSVKSNLGHLNVAAGIAALIKTVLALKHGHVPPSVNFKRPNPRIDFDSSPFYVATELHDWPLDDAPRRAGVNSYGVGGTNAHVILESAPTLPHETRDAARAPQLLVLSARSQTSLERATTNLAEHLRRTPEANLPDVAHTLQVGRRAFPYRRFVVASDAAEAAQALEGARSCAPVDRDGRGCEREAALTAVGQRWLAGECIDWRALAGHRLRRRVPLPTYAFDRRRCWVDIPTATAPSTYDAAL